MKNLFPIFLFAVFAAAFLLPVVADAKNNAEIEFVSKFAGESGNPGEFIGNFYKFALAISGLLAFGAIVWGGIKYTASAGSPSGQTEGKQWITGALWGLLLLAGAYLILKTINPDIVNLELKALENTGSDSTGAGRRR